MRPDAPASGGPAVFFVGAGLLGGSWLVVRRRDGVSRAEERVFVQINTLADELHPVLWGPMQAGNVAGSLALVGVAHAVRHDRRLSVAALLASQSAFWSAKVIKRWVARGRPAAYLPATRERERASGLGFVSGHAAVAGALAAVLGRELEPAARVGVTAVALTVAMGRIYVGAHLPLDVVGGAGLGLMTGAVARRVAGLDVPGRDVRSDCGAPARGSSATPEGSATSRSQGGS